MTRQASKNRPLYSREGGAMTEGGSRPEVDRCLGPNEQAVMRCLGRSVSPLPIPTINTCIQTMLLECPVIRAIHRRDKGLIDPSNSKLAAKYAKRRE